MSNYIAKEVQHGALIGPYTDLPFTWIHLSPLMTRQKSTDGRRIIVDLPVGRDINSYISKNVVYGRVFPHRLPTTDQLVDIVKHMNFQAYAFSVDISRAYRNFQSDPLDWPLLGVAFEGNVYVDIAMPFGARMSSLYMQRVAEFITRSLRTQNIKVLIYLDD